MNTRGPHPLKAVKRLVRFLPWAILVPGFLTCLQGSTLSFRGDLRSDATYLPPGSSFTDQDYAQWAAVVHSFTVTSPSSMEAITFSYGGGTNGNGVVIAQGGFQPYLSLFTASGGLLNSTFIGTTCPPGSNINRSTGLCLDVSLYGGLLSPGTYAIAISAFENVSFAENLGAGALSDGFAGLGNLAEGEDLHYAFDLILSTPVAVPEPSTIGTVGLLLLPLTILAKRKGLKP